ncbi:MAG: hypothetical protein IT534_09195 [Bauldia sp.]|nr:hypothetical protein [Bauldia sp.]
MAKRILRTASVAAVVALGTALPNVASAQGLTTPYQVGLDLDAGCATTPNGELLDKAACLSAILTAVGVAEQYAGAGGDPATLVPPQLDIGYYLCQLGIRVPEVLGDIASAIEDAININLETGCQQAVENVTIPTPPPVSRN